MYFVICRKTKIKKKEEYKKRPGGKKYTAEKAASRAAEPNNCKRWNCTKEKEESNSIELG
jgi:hypothetical protein